MGGNKTSIALLATLFALGCSKETPAPPPAPVTTASAPPRAEKPPPALDFHVVAKGRDPMALSAVSPSNLLVASHLVFELAQGKLRQAPELGRGAPRSFVASGQFPDAVWTAARVEPDAEEGASEAHTVAFKWTTTGWVKTATLRDGEELAGIAPWSDGRAIALVKIGAYDVRFALVGGQGPVALPAPTPYTKPKSSVEKPTRATQPDATPAQDDAAAPAALDAAALPEAENVTDAGAAQGVKCKTQVVLPVSGPEPLRTLAALPSGEVFRVGYECREDDAHVLAVERWAARQRKSVIERLPETPVSAPSAPLIFARGPEDARVVVLGAPRAWLAELAGGRWTVAKLPFSAAITDAAQAADGSLLLAAGASLHRQEKTGAPFVEIAVPEVTRIERVHAVTKDDVWLVGRDASGQSVLLHTRPTPQPIELPRAADVAGMQKSNKRSPATGACDRVYVHLQTLGPTGAKPPNRFPKLAGVVATDPELGKLEFVIEDDGMSTYLGAKASSVELARKLVSALLKSDKKAGESAQIFCHDPKLKNKNPITL